MSLSKQYRAIKLILFPRYSTIWDIFLLLKDLSTSSRTPKNLDFLPKDPNIRLAGLALSHMDPIIIRTTDKSIVKEKNISDWLERSKLILETLIELKDYTSARAFVIEFISTYFFLVTLYVMQQIDKKSLREMFGSIKFDDGAIVQLMNFIKSESWKNVLVKLDVYDAFDVLLRFYAFSIKEMIKKLNKDVIEDISKKLAPLLELFKNEEELFALYERTINKVISKRDGFLSKMLSSSIIILIEGYARCFLTNDRNVESLNRLKKFLIKSRELYEFSKSFSNYSDVGVLSFHTSIEILSGIIDNNIERAMGILRSLGLLLIKEKEEIIGVTERSMLKLPPEIFSLPPPLTPPPINMVDRLSPSNFLLLANEILEEITTSGLERKNILKTALLMNPNYFKQFLFRSVSDPVSSFALLFLMGSPSVFLFETIIFITTQLTDSSSDRLLCDIISSLDILLRVKKNIVQHLDARYKERYPYVTQLASFYLYRDSFLISLMMTNETRQKIVKTTSGKRLMKTLNEIYNYLEKIYGKTPLVKKEDISELFA